MDNKENRQFVELADRMIADRYKLMKVYEMEQGFWDTQDYIIADKIMHNIEKSVFSLLTDLLKK